MNTFQKLKVTEARLAAATASLIQIADMVADNDFDPKISAQEILDLLPHIQWIKK